MPLERLHDHQNTAWALWKITEDEQTLAREVFQYEQVSERITNPLKRLEFYAGRVVLKALLQKWSLPFEGLVKDEAGKPYFRNHNIHMSLTHSYPYVAAIVDRNKSVGIDLEQPKDKLLKIAHRVLNEEELQDAGNDVVKHCIYWCTKEALIKVYGKRHLHLSKELAIAPFPLKTEGKLLGSILATDMFVTMPLYYRVYDNFVVVFNT